MIFLRLLRAPSIYASYRRTRLYSRRRALRLTWLCVHNGYASLSSVQIR